MITRKSGLLALVVSAAAFLGACESKAPIVNLPQTHVDTTVTISPNPVPQLKKGQTAQLVAVVSGTGTQSVTWSVLSGSNVVSVSATGLVTALNPGVATVQAVSTVNSAARAAVSISVADTIIPGGGTPGQPTIAITSVTSNVGGLNAPVNPNAVVGNIDVLITYDIPAGTNVGAIRATLDGTEVCRQTFTAGSSADAAIEASSVPQQFVCSINTARLGPNGVAQFLNGVHTLRAELLSPTGTVVASATYQPLNFANVDVVAVNITTTKGPVAGPGGFSWRGGDVTVTLTPAIYTGATNNLTSATVSLQPSTFAAISTAAGADFNASCSITRTAPAGFGAAPTLAAPGCVAGAATRSATTFTNNVATVTFPQSANFAASGTGGTGNIEDPNLTVTVTGLTAAGNNFIGGTPVTINGVPTSATNPLRLDNLAPRFTLLDITPATVGCAPSTSCYLNGSFTFTSANNTTPAAGTTAGTVDYGVDLQTTTFQAGTSASTLTTVTNPSGLPETAVSNTNILAATTTDALGNSRQNFATALATCASSSSTTPTAVGPACAGGSIQLFGVDLTPPTMTTTGFANNSTAAAPGATNTLTFSATDAATPPAGPSGISGIRVKVEQITPTGTVCLNPANTPASTAGFSATVQACSAAATVLLPNPATVTLPDAAAYYRVTATPVDLAGNAGTSVVRVQLRDFTPPVAGGIACPSTINGGTDVSCSIFATDNVDLGDLLPTVQYSGAALELEYPRTALGTYGFDVFTTTNSATPQFTIAGFIRSIQTTNGAGAPNAFAANAFLADFANAYIRDVAAVQLDNQCVIGVASPAPNTSTQNCTRRQDNILPNVQQGASTTTAFETSGFESAGRPFGTGTNNGGTAFTQTGAATSVCSDNPTGAAAGCATVTARSVTLTATATGPALTFANPFARTLFYATDPVSGRSFQVCAAAATSVTDNTTVGTRTWTYSCTWTPTVPAAAYTTFALGVDASGRALMSNTRAVTVTSD